jgi:hypothetical protein
MIKEYLIFLAVVLGLLWNNIYASAQSPLTSAQLQQQAKQKSRDKVCARIRKGTKHDTLCGIDKNILW